MTDLAEIDFLPATEISARVRRRALSPVDVVERSLARIAALNPRFNAFVAVDAERALAEARSQTARLARGDDPGPLAGLPLGVKDLEDAAGFRTTHGSRAFAEAPPATADAIHVARLRAAGAIVIGKTNTPEFGATPWTDNALFGPTRNPWNPERTAGGSSGGAGAAIAAGMAPLATASDGGGSVRIPACYCGLYGLKPSYGRVPMGPRAMLTWMDTSVHGALTRSVADAALYLDQIVGAHPADPDSLPHPGYRYADVLDRPLPRLRLAYNRTLGVTRLQPDVEREVETAVQVFRDLGHTVEENTDAIVEMGGWWSRMAAFQALSTLWETYSTQHDAIGAPFVAQMDAALDVDFSDFREFYRLRTDLHRWLGELFGRYDLLLTPTLPTEAFGAVGPIPEQIPGEPNSGIALTYPFNFTGHPAASVPAGFTDAGLPCGLQIVGPRFREDLLLQVSAAYERERPWAGRRPAL